MTLATPGSVVSCGARAFDAAALLVRRSRRRAHLGGRSVDGKIQATFARLQLEHGDCLSQRTLRWRHMTQLRNFDASAGVDGGVLELADSGEVAFFSEPKAKAPALTLALAGELANDPTTASPCDILQSGHMRYCIGRLMMICPYQRLPYCREAEESLILLPARAKLHRI